MSLCQCGCGQRTTLSEQARRGYRKGEPQRFILGHARRGRFQPVLERIRATEELRDLGYETPCLVQPSGLLRSGYGQITERLPGRKRRTLRTHRAVWEAERGPIPDGYEIDHACHPVDGSCAGGVTCPHRACHELTHLRLTPVPENRRRTVRNALAGRTHA